MIAAVRAVVTVHLRQLLLWRWFIVPAEVRVLGSFNFRSTIADARLRTAVMMTMLVVVPGGQLAGQQHQRCGEPDQQQARVRGHGHRNGRAALRESQTQLNGADG